MTDLKGNIDEASSLKMTTNPSEYTEYGAVFSVFKKLIDELLKDQGDFNNLVIGGSLALHLHGLNFRTPTDVDLIIYNPSPSQLSTISALKVFDSISTYKVADQDRRAFKFQKDGATLDIIIERKPRPNSLLFTVFDRRQYMVQKIGDVIKAKTSYSHRNNEGVTYIRQKDLEDCMNLKNDNFNIGNKSQIF